MTNSNTAALSSLSDDSLRKETQSCAKREKEEAAALIRHLIEVNKRKLHLEWGFASLFSYLTDELGYDNSSAALRQKAVQAAETLPDVDQKIAKGEISLRAIRSLESFIYHEEKERKQRLSMDEKKKLYAEFQHEPVREIERKLVERSTSEKFKAPKKETDRPVRGGRRLLSLSLSDDDYELIKMAREVLSHRFPNASLEEIVVEMAHFYVDRKHPVRKAERALKKTQARKTMRAKDNGSRTKGTKETESRANEMERKDMLPESAPEPTQVDRSTIRCIKKTSRAGSAQERHQAWRNYDKKGCQWRDPRSGRRCGSKHKPELDHIRPFASSGESTAANFQVLCANHNQLKAQREMRF